MANARYCSVSTVQYYSKQFLQCPPPPAPMCTRAKRRRRRAVSERRSRERGPHRAVSPELSDAIGAKPRRVDFFCHGSSSRLFESQSAGDDVARSRRQMRVDAESFFLALDLHWLRTGRAGHTDGERARREGENHRGTFFPSMTLSARNRTLLTSCLFVARSIYTLS